MKFVTSPMASIYIGNDSRDYHYIVAMDREPDTWRGVASAMVDEQLLMRLVAAQKEYLATQAILSDLYANAYDKRR